MGWSGTATTTQSRLGTARDQLFAWFLVPLMQATLYVFVLHVYFALLSAHGPGS